MPEQIDIIKGIVYNYILKHYFYTHTKHICTENLKASDLRTVRETLAC